MPFRLNYMEITHLCFACRHVHDEPCEILIATGQCNLHETEKELSERTCHAL